jgi:hypothetical protein
MTMRTFIRDNRAALDAHILKACPNIGRLNDNERRMWIENDEALYLWARGEGVPV